MVVNRINEILYEWDPISLKDSHVPNDEYMPEAQLINNCLLSSSEPDVLATEIYEVFSKFFGASCFNKPLDECLDIAKKCLSLDLTDDSF